nr:hypothetical protein [uncultured Mediterranean phage uvMED]
MRKSTTVFLEGNSKPVTTAELAKMTGIPRYILTTRALRCESRKYFKGEFCPVFGDKDLKEPVSRNIPRKKIQLNLSKEELETLQDSFKKIKDGSPAIEKLKKAFSTESPAKKAISRWDQQVRLSNER